MKKLLLLFFIIPFFNFSQTQIGDDIDGEAVDDQSGASVSMSSDGTIVAIGAPFNDDNELFSGHVRVYQNQSGTWIQVGQDIDGEASNNQSGRSISLSDDGSIVAIGSQFNNGGSASSGHVRVYQNQSGTWTQIGQDIDSDTFNDQSGTSVSLSGNGSIVAIGAIGGDGNGTDSGHVRVYQNQSGTWTQIGQDIDGEATFDRSGQSVSLSNDGSIVAIGAIGNAGNGVLSGHVRVYQNQSGTWTQIGQDIDGEAAFDESGTSISLSGNGSIIAIGAIGNADNSPISGHVRVYQNQSNTWTQVGQDIDGEFGGDLSGMSVSLSSDGSIVAIGATGNSSSSGHVRVYQNQSNTWIQIGQDIDGETNGDRSGQSVSLSSDGSILAIGALQNDGNGSNSGHVRVFDLNTVLSSDDFVLSQFSLYPNPTKNNVTIELNQGIELQNINIYNNLGQFINSSKNIELNTSHLSTGLYYLEIETNKGRASKKLIIE